MRFIGGKPRTASASWDHGRAFTGGETLTNLTDDNFESEVISDRGLCMVHFAAEWSGACHIMAPVIEELAETFSGLVKVGLLDVDKNHETRERYGILTVPSFLFFKKGRVLGQVVGAASKRQLKNTLEAMLAESSRDRLE